MPNTEVENNHLVGDARRAAIAFGFDPDRPVGSLCPYGPVYKMALGGRQYVLKRTGYPRSDAKAIADWLRYLRQEDVSVVFPCDRFEENPRKINDTDAFAWVVYGFIEGKKYRGTLQEVSNAGSLLGSIHKAGLNYYGNLIQPEHVAATDSVVVHNRMQEVVNLIRAKGVKESTIEVINGKILAVAKETKLGKELPFAACSWDYKASNLIVSEDNTMTLIDPDHAGRIPRIYDLACSVVLFHSDHPEGPRRLWNAEEWKRFLRAYTNHVALTDCERTAWSMALSLAWVNEGLWLLTNFPEGWADAGETEYLLSVAAFDPAQFPLE